MNKEKPRAFTASEGMKNEYCAKIVRIGEMKPIEGSDFLMQTFMDGFSCVVAKDAFSPGEPVIYCLNETAINLRFLAVNNQFAIDEYERNANAKEVAVLIEAGHRNEAKRQVGFFNKHGRVKMINLRGCPSYGCIFKFDALVRWKPSLADEDLESYFTVDENGYEHPFNFDTVNGELFAEVYIPKVRNSWRGLGKQKQRNRKVDFDRMVPGQFAFHYDTSQLRDNMWRFRPDTPINISVKMHGTSVIIGNLLTRIPVRLSLLQSKQKHSVQRSIRKLQKAPARFPWQRQAQQQQLEHLQQSLPQAYRTGYGPIYSSRTVIKNQYINDSLGPGFYDSDIWSEYGDLLFPYLPQGMTLYGEICGYVSGSATMIQQQYDYGCHSGDNFVMPYRITTTDEEGNHREWEVNEVVEWTLNMKAQLKETQPELSDRLKPIPVLYEGTLGQLYPDLDPTTHWHENVLERLATDSQLLGMELPEPLCSNKVPREGVVLRIVGDSFVEAFKLKSNAFFERETKLIDKGEVDMETLATT